MQVINNILVWPQRLLIPIMRNDPEVIGRMAKLYSHCGVIKIEVLQAEDLVPALTTLNRNHPWVELTADGKRRPGY